MRDLCQLNWNGTVQFYQTLFIKKHLENKLALNYEIIIRSINIIIINKFMYKYYYFFLLHTVYKNYNF